MSPFPYNPAGYFTRRIAAILTIAGSILAMLGGCEPTTSGTSSARDLSAGSSARVSSESGGAVGIATFAGGCFWCTEADFDKVEGVISTTSGYIGGMAVDPTYQQVVTGRTGHTEAVEVVYDPKVVSYERLLDVFWKNHDPLAKDRQFCDRGNQYRPGVFYHNEEQRALAEATRKPHQARFKQPIQTEITAATTFYKA